MQVWISDDVADAYVKEHGGIDAAKEAIQELVADHAPGGGS